MINKLVEYVTTQTSLSMIWEDEKRDNGGYRILLVTSQLTLAPEEIIEQVIEYWKSLNPANTVIYSTDLKYVPITFVEGDEKESTAE